MGNKAHPIVLRLGLVRDWDSNWYADSNYAELVYEDFLIRKFIRQELARAGLSKVIIKRKPGFVEVCAYVARPGAVLGKGNANTMYLNEELTKLIKKNVRVDIYEQKNPEANARLLVEWICGQLEKRIPFRRAMKMAMQKGIKAGAKGIKVCCSGRLGGVEIARTEWYREGRVPLHTLRADIDYELGEALTTYGKIGVKVWIYNGERIEKYNENPDLVEESALTAERG
ncbi:30S ribosomal protein S3 [Candidatus Margulisiibacteriota bacterium]